jgi:hypothetical protein
VLIKKYVVCVQECVELLKRVMPYFDSENISFNAEFMWNNILVKSVSASFRNYKIIFQRLTNLRLFPT